MIRTSKKIERALEQIDTLYIDCPDTYNEPYLTYIKKVYSFCRSENERLVALLSGTLIHKKMTERELLFAYGATVRDAVKIYTPVEGESLDAYLSRIKNNPIARAVKIAELKHLNEIPGIDHTEFDRQLSILNP